MQIDAALVGVIITVLSALFGIAFWVGVLSNKVRNNQANITDIRIWISEFQRDNKADHTQINNKLDRILLNGKVK